ncbi:MAG: hypothetical protein ACT4PL_07385 [Phycisphaerales bacterium]
MHPLDDPMVRRLVETYLGPNAAQADGRRPGLLLEMLPGPVNASTVIAATQRQLARISAVLPASSADGARLRMLVQEAAAQVMAGLEPTSPAPSSGTLGRAVRSGKAAPIDPGLLRDAESVVAKFGGIDAQALATLNAMAASRGLPATAVPAVLNALLRPDMPARRSEDQSEASYVGATGAVSEEPEEDPGVAFLKQAALIGGLVFVVLVLALAAGVIALSGRKGPETGPEVSKAGSTLAPTGGAADGSGPKPTEPEASPIAPAAAAKAEIDDGTTADVAAIVRQARRAVELAGDPTTAQDGERLFRKNLRVLGEAWTRMEPGQRTASTELVVDYLYKIAERPKEVERTVQAIAAMTGPLRDRTRRLASGEVGPVAWACGMLLRLTRERDLGGGGASQAERALTEALSRDRPTGNARFESGALAALRVMPLRMVDPRPANDEDVRANAARGRVDSAETARAFDQWERAVRAGVMVSASAGLGNEGERQASELIVLEGLQRVLIDAVEPDEDRGVMEAIGTLTMRLRWREQEGARRRLLQWFDEKAISNADLQTLTSALVTRSSAEGVDVTMVLSHGATGEQRAQLKDAYAIAWQMAQQVTGGALAEQWSRTAREQLSRSTETAETLLEEMRSAALLAKVNEAAWRRSRGDNAGAADALAVGIPLLMPAGSGALLATGPNSVILTFTQTAPGASDSRDGEWTLRFLADRSRPDLKAAIVKELETVKIGPIDADVLAETALMGTESVVRLAAQRVCVTQSGNAAVVNAMLRVLPRATRRGDVALTIERVANQPLVGWQNERWPLEARRALVERLLELVAGDSSTRPMDQMCAALAESYRVAMGEPASAGGITPEEAGRSLREAGAELSKRLRARAETYAPNPAAPLSLDAIERLNVGRLALARGVVQEFAAEQAGCAELLAYVVSGEQPGRAPVVATIMRMLSQKRREATTSIEQIKHTEAAMTRLWMLRAGEEAP